MPGEPGLAGGGKVKAAAQRSGRWSAATAARTPANPATKSASRSASRSATGSSSEAAEIAEFCATCGWPGGNVRAGSGVSETESGNICLLIAKPMIPMTTAPRMPHPTRLPKSRSPGCGDWAIAAMRWRLRGTAFVRALSLTLAHNRCRGHHHGEQHAYQRRPGHDSTAPPHATLFGRNGHTNATSSTRAAQAWRNFVFSPCLRTGSARFRPIVRKCCAMDTRSPKRTHGR